MHINQYTQVTCTFTHACIHTDRQTDRQIHTQTQTDRHILVVLIALQDVQKSMGKINVVK